jgi:subtilisin family serine protease
MRPLSRATVLAAALVLATSSTAAAASLGGVSDGTTTERPSWDTSVALVQLNGDPLSTYVKTKPTHGKKIDFTSSTTKAYRAQLSALRNDFKQWLQANAPKAKITGSWDIALNAVSVQLNGTKLSTLTGAPQVQHVEYEGLYHPLIENPDLALIDAVAAWSAVGGAANAGQGVKIAIVDSGIDINNPCFDDAGYASQPQLGDTTYTNNKVIAAKVFYNKNASRGFTPEAVFYHGTHVAGIAACNYNVPMTIDGVSIPYGMSGVAPRALLGNYNIFPDEVDNARSEDIIDALEAAYSDGFDVANMSLGGGASGVNDLLSMAVDDLDQANMVIAVAAGNSGDGSDTGDHPFFPPGHYTIESPGSAARALTAGSYTVGHAIVSGFSIGGATYIALPGDFATVDAPLTAPVAILTDAPVNAASGFSEVCGTLPAHSLDGMIAMIGRGTCDFSWKIRTAELAGAVGVIMVNRVSGDPIPMGLGTPPDGVQPTIPAYMISLEDGIYIRTHSTSGDAGTITLPFYYDNNHDYIQSSFSSQGPTDVDFRVKPDVMAPGENVISSIPDSWCDDPPCFAFLNGTSMATPHLAGAAAIVRQAHPDWDAAAVRSAVVNTAAEGLIVSAADGTTVLTDPNIIGSGSLDLDAAVDASVALDPVSISFGAISGGSGTTATFALKVTNLTGFSQTLSFAVSGSGGGVTFSAPSSVTLAAGASAWVAVGLTSAKGATAGAHNGMLRVSVGGSEVAHAAVFVLVKN